MKFSGNVGNGPLNKFSNFGGDPDSPDGGTDIATLVTGKSCLYCRSASSSQMRCSQCDLYDRVNSLQCLFHMALLQGILYFSNVFYPRDDRAGITCRRVIVCPSVCHKSVFY